MASPGTDSLPRPRGHYAKYKRATQHFLQWLWDARSCGIALDVSAATSSKIKRKNAAIVAPLDVYERVVAAIVREPSGLTPTLLSRWTRALGACESSITLREQFAVYFPPPKENDGHVYFVSRLRAWLGALRGVEANSSTVKAAREDVGSVNFANYYDVLSLSDDFFGEDATNVVLPSSSSSSKSDMDPDALFNEAFASDLHMELMSLLAELDELCESIYSAFIDVKLQRKTLVEATVVSKLAIAGAATVIARLQVRYPAIRSAQNLVTALNDRIPNLQQIWMETTEAWFPSRRYNPLYAAQRPNKSPGYQYPVGSVVADFVWVHRELTAFVLSLPPDPTHTIVVRDARFGEVYNEETTPDFICPDPFSMSPFFQQHLPVLYNGFATLQLQRQQLSTDSLKGWFYKPIFDMFATKNVTMEGVFSCICWVRSVAALHGDAGLSRTVALSLLQRWDAEKRLAASIAKGEMRRADPSLHSGMALTLPQMQAADDMLLALRVNPMLAGFAFLDSQFQFLHLGAESLNATTRFPAFCHLYVALRDRKLIGAIPLAEELLQVYGGLVFSPSRSAAVHGAFLRTYLVSACDMTSASVDAMLQDRPPPSSRQVPRRRFHLGDVSRLFRLLTANDYSVLPASCASSWRSLFTAATAVANEELFASRVLSCDTLTLSDDLATLFDSLCDVLGLRADVNEMAADVQPGLTPQQNAIRVLEDVVMFRLIPFLDCLDLNGAACETEDARQFLRQRGAQGAMALGGAAMRSILALAAGTISRFFASKRVESYYTLPKKPRWTILEFGSIEFDHNSRGHNRHFGELMDMLKRKTGRLSRDEDEELKDAVMDDVGLLATSGYAHGDLGLSSIFHYAVAGPSRDRRLVEWLIAMGGVLNEAKHCRDPPKIGGLGGYGFARSELANALAVHCAAANGDALMVRHVLEASLLRDLNTVTFHTKDSLAHVAVARGHWQVYQLLEDYGADVTRPNAAGQHVYDLTADREWKRRIIALAVSQRRQHVTMKPSTSPAPPELKRAHQKTQSQLRRELDQQREAARVAEASSTQSKSKSKKKSSKKKKNKGSTAATSVDTVTSALAALAVEAPAPPPPPSSSSKSDPSLSALLRQSHVPSIALQAVEMVDALKTGVQYFLVPVTYSIGMEARQRAALEASDGVFQLAKYHRQLSPDALATDPSSPLFQLQQRASLSDFWVSLALTTAYVLQECSRATQALEMFDAVERRLLKTPQRPLHFRACVQQYVEARQRAHLSPATASTPEAAREFEWYLSDVGRVRDDEVLLALDRLQGCRLFTSVPATLGWRLPLFRHELKSEEEKADVFVALETQVVIGSDSKEHVRAAVERVRALCESHDTPTQVAAIPSPTPRISVFGFEFSQTGIKRET